MRKKDNQPTIHTRTHTRTQRLQLQKQRLQLQASQMQQVRAKLPRKFRSTHSHPCRSPPLDTYANMNRHRQHIQGTRSMHTTHGAYTLLPQPKHRQCATHRSSHTYRDRHASCIWDLQRLQCPSMNNCSSSSSKSRSRSRSSSVHKPRTAVGHRRQRKLRRGFGFQVFVEIGVSFFGFFLSVFEEDL